MTKILFVLLFTFISLQSFSQIYLMSIHEYDMKKPNCELDEITLVTVDPEGNQTMTCNTRKVQDGALIWLNKEINNIINLGYNLREIIYSDRGVSEHYGQIFEGTYGQRLRSGTSFIFEKIHSK